MNGIVVSLLLASSLLLGEEVASEEIGPGITRKEEVVEESVAQEEPTSITISAAGDCTLGKDKNATYSWNFVNTYNENGFEYFLTNVKDIFSNDDLTIVNLEGVFTTSNSRVNKTFAFKGDPAYVQILQSASVEAVSLANNHSADYGTSSAADTKNILNNANISWTSHEENRIVEVDGVKVGLVGVYELPYGNSIQTSMEQRIRQVREDGAQIVILTIHWGDEGMLQSNSIQRNLGRSAIDAGADLVLGHHPHVLQEIELYNGKYIVYSLGNFSFGGNSNPKDKDTMIFQQTFTLENDTVIVDNQINIIPCSISSVSGHNNFQPTPLVGTERERVLDKIQRYSNFDIRQTISE